MRIFAWRKKKNCLLQSRALSASPSLQVKMKTAMEEIPEWSFSLKNIDISPMSAKEFDHALAAPFKDIEDSLQYFSALAAKCSILITRNKKDFPNGESVMVLTPQEFFDCFSDELKW